MDLKGIVRIWEENVTIPTYSIGKPEKNPIFLEKRVYQGSSGVVYPHPVIEKIEDEKQDKIYHAVFLENEYLKIMILPELGGRIQMAYDKVKQRHFIYYNQVIKPALVGLTGPWISGGIEFNWPQHHRPSTFDPVDFKLEEHEDGSKTVWVSEVERMFRTKGMAGFRLYPGKAYLEINAKLYNRTPFAQTFLWWANPAVKVNDHYQSVFPPDVHAVFDHGKRDVSEFPIARGTYYKVDYSAGVDISRYKNIPVPTSYMAVKSKYNFMGGYEHDTGGGLLHVADHHISPGKKQWTWGHGDFGRAWDRNLTDEDGPYIELMTGVFTDNQPDFSWILPFEERSFTQYFMPYAELGVVKNASREALVNLDVEKNKAYIKFYSTAAHAQLSAVLEHKGKTIWSDTFAISPANPYLTEVGIEGSMEAHELRIALYSGERLLIEYTPERKGDKPVPDPARPAKLPQEIESPEQLYLTGLHIEQYRHATYKATDYYLEALKREPGDIRCNNAMGLWSLRRGQFAQAKPYFLKAIETLTDRNPNPYDSEPYFNLGLCLMYQEDYAGAYDAFYKSAWTTANQDSAYLNLARIASRQDRLPDALMLIEKSLIRNYHNHTARHLKTVILRKLGHTTAAVAWASASLETDQFNAGCLFELYILQPETPAGKQALRELTSLLRGNVHTYLEYSLDYAHAGLYDEAVQLLTLYIVNAEQGYPMAYYYIARFLHKSGKSDLSLHYLKKAAAANSDYCFPNRIEEIDILLFAMSVQPNDAKAPYYLGNFWYANRQYPEAIACWEQSVHIDASFATVHRNLALAYHNNLHDETRALKSLETAFALDTSDARVLMELDQLRKKMNTPHTERLKFLEAHLALTTERDDLYLERIALYNQLRQHEKALALIRMRKFHPWEGGEGKVVGQYLVSLIELAKQAIQESRFTDALSLLTQAETYPHNLGEGKLAGASENDIFYLKGCCYEQLGDSETATRFFTRATLGQSEPVQAVYYNDQQPDKIFYQGLAWNKLGNATEASRIFNRLIDFGTRHLNDRITIDYFAVSLPDLLVFDQDLNLLNMVHCHYLIALGNLGLGGSKLSRAEEHFQRVLSLNVNHTGALVHQAMISEFALHERA
jgi:tetratricopeptide (TPR) repeat protein